MEPDGIALLSSERHAVVISVSGPPFDENPTRLPAFPEKTILTGCELSNVSWAPENPTDITEFTVVPDGAVTDVVDNGSGMLTVPVQPPEPLIVMPDGIETEKSPYVLVAVISSGYDSLTGVPPVP